MWISVGVRITAFGDGPTNGDIRKRDIHVDTISWFYDRVYQSTFRGESAAPGEPPNIPRMRLRQLHLLVSFVDYLLHLVSFFFCFSISHPCVFSFHSMEEQARGVFDNAIKVTLSDQEKKRLMTYELFRRGTSRNSRIASYFTPAYHVRPITFTTAQTNFMFPSTLCFPTAKKSSFLHSYYWLYKKKKLKLSATFTEKSGANGVRWAASNFLIQASN